MSDEKLPLVSILISSYNQHDLLPIAIKSALDQDYKNLEVVVSDDGSERDISPIIKSFSDSRLKVFINSENLGRKENYRNLVYKHSKGKYLTMLNADDYYIDNSFITQVVNVFNEYSNVVLVHAYNKVLITDTGKIITKSIPYNQTKIIDGTEFFLNSPYRQTIEHLTAVYPRRLANQIDVYRISTMSEDWEFLLRMIVGHKYAILPMHAGMITRHTSNVSSKISPEDFGLHDRYIHSIFQYFSEKKTIPIPELEKWKFFMLKRHHIKWLIKAWFIDPNLEKEYMQFMKREYPSVLRSIENDLRFMLYKFIRRYDFLMHFAFKHFMNQENFIADLQSRRK